MNCAIIFGLSFLLLDVVSGETKPKSSMKHAISLETTTLIRTMPSTQLTKDLTTTMVTESRLLSESTTETQSNTNPKFKDGLDTSVNPPIVITTESQSRSPKFKDGREISVTPPIVITGSTDFYDFEKGTTSDDANSLYQTNPSSTTKDWNYNGVIKTSNYVTNPLTHLQENTTEWVGISSHLYKSLNGKEDSTTPRNSDYETKSHYLQPEGMAETEAIDTSLNIADIVVTPTPHDSDRSNYATHKYATLQTSTTLADKNLYTSINTLRSFVYTTDSNEGLESLSAFEVTQSSLRQDGNIEDILEIEDGSRETENDRNLELENSTPNLSQEDKEDVPEALNSTMKSSENNETLREYHDNVYPNNFTESSRESSKAEEDTFGTENIFHFTSTEYSQARTMTDAEKNQTESSAWESYTSSVDTDNGTKTNNDASDRVTEITKSIVREERKFAVNGEEPADKSDIYDTSDTVLPDVNPFNVTSVFSAGKPTLTSTTHNVNVETTLPSIKETYNSWSSESTTIASGAFSTISTDSTKIQELKPTLGNKSKSRVNPNVSSTDWIILLSSLKSAFNLSDETIASFTDPSINWFDVTKKQNFINFTTAAPESAYETSTSYASTEIRKISKEELFYFYIIGGSLLVMLLAILTLMVVHFFRRNQRDSVDISEIPHLNLKMDDYRLAPIPRISTASNFKTGDPILSHHYLLENASDNMPQKMQTYKTSPFFMKPS